MSSVNNYFASMGMKILLLLVILAVSFVYSQETDDYCRISSCNPGSHVLCKFDSPDPADRCADVSRAYLSLEEKVSILNLHNHFRWLVYTGQEERGAQQLPQPPATNVTYLKWDPELEKIAHRWAVQCINGYAECSTIDEYPVNQLYDNYKNRQNLRDVSIIESILWNWYSEVISFDSADVEYFNEKTAHFSQSYHYTQMVWEKTTKIGCSAIRYSDSRYYRVKLVCNYWPAGNIQGQPVYKIGSLENHEYSL